ncbi:MAG: D-aminoacyl-tRNA deacylase, partial [Bacillota bacterium]
MRAVIQRVRSANVQVDGQVVGRIGRGLLVLLGVGQGDGEADAVFMADKVAGLRIFEDDQGKMNLAPADV